MLGVQVPPGLPFFLLLRILTYGRNERKSKNNNPKSNPVSQRSQGGVEESCLAVSEADDGFDRGCNNYCFYRINLLGHN
jgi:hypothetical protein